VKTLNRAAPLLLALTLLAGCASTEVTSRQRYAGPTLARPDRIVVNEFGATPAEVPSHSALADEAAAPTPQTPEDVEVGRKLGAEVARQLTAELRGMGLPAVQGSEQAAQPGDVVVDGNFYGVEEGSTGKRVLLGFGSGAADLRTAVEVYRVAPDGSLRHLAGGTTDSAGGKTPGLVVPLAVAAATANPLGLIVVGAMKLRGEGTGSGAIEGAAERTADEIAAQLETGARRQGWI
jgi:hypothetical protein